MPVVTRPIRVLFVAPHPVEGPSTRFRIHQFLPYLRARGVEGELRPLFTSAEAQVIYGSGHVLRKAALTVRGALRRLRDVADAGRFDLVYILREAFPFGPAWFERALARCAGRMIFDFDDAIYTRSTNFSNPLDRLRDWSKPAELIRRADAVIPGSAVLAGYAQRFTPGPGRIEVLPTVVDAEAFTPDPSARDPDRVTIGWIGTPRNTSYLRSILPAFDAIAAGHPNARFVFVGAEPFECGSAPVSFREWRLDREIDDLRGFDIGIMPLADDEQARGKCGFKLIEYMAVGAACVASPVGANLSILEPGRTGFFASSPAEWTEALDRLAGSPDLRRRMGAEGRARVESRYSVQAVAPRLLAVIRRAVGAPASGAEPRTGASEPAGDRLATETRA
jgi:glycosyltransferase involved in cell wall biosynthesis